MIKLLKILMQHWKYLIMRLRRLQKSLKKFQEYRNFYKSRGAEKFEKLSLTEKEQLIEQKVDFKQQVTIPTLSYAQVVEQESKIKQLPIDTLQKKAPIKTYLYKYRIKLVWRSWKST